jgi:hypothetical protein
MYNKYTVIKYLPRAKQKTVLDLLFNLLVMNILLRAYFHQKYFRKKVSRKFIKVRIRTFLKVGSGQKSYGSATLAARLFITNIVNYLPKAARETIARAKM